MRLRKPCQHDLYDPHEYIVSDRGNWDVDWAACPGGEFLTEGGDMRFSVWWCDEHDASFQREPDPAKPTWPCWAYDGENCRPVEMILLPLEVNLHNSHNYSELVERIALVLCATHGGIEYLGERDYQLAVAILEALSEAPEATDPYDGIPAPHL